MHSTEHHTMSSFFGDLTGGGISMPNTVFDQSSMLPPLNTAGYGAGYDGTPDARINAGSSLFRNMQPYAYGKDDRLTTQTAYLANPHNIQKIVPQLVLPDPPHCVSACNFTLPHAVSDGDVAFSIRFTGTSVRTNLMRGTSDFFRQGAGRAVDYICNIATINYIMRGLFTQEQIVNPAWRHFSCALGFEEAYNNVQLILDTAQIYDKLLKSGATNIGSAIMDVLNKKLQYHAELLVRDHFRPLGVVIGSDKQGGQHEGSNKGITWPVAYIVTITIDGRNENLCNFWRHLDISSGSDLGFYVHMKTNHTYTLNHHKQMARKHFGRINGQESVLLYPQLCPGAAEHNTNDKSIEGHWHFCMPQMMHQKVTDSQTYNDISTFHAGALLTSTVSVTWIRKHKKPWNFFGQEAKKGGYLDTHDELTNKRFQERRDEERKAATSGTKDGPKLGQPFYLMSSSNPRAHALQQRVQLRDVDTPPQTIGVKRDTESVLDMQGFSERIKMQRPGMAYNSVYSETRKNEVPSSDMLKAGGNDLDLGGQDALLSPRGQKSGSRKKVTLATSATTATSATSVRVTETAESVGIGSSKKSPVV